MTRRQGERIPPADLDDDVEEAPHTSSFLSAQGAFRAVLLALTLWTLFEGFALATGALSPVDTGEGRTAERILGGLMIVLGGVYAVIAWQRERYRLLLWVPFAAQLAIVVPLLFEFPDNDSMGLLIISSLFLALMCYVWWRSRELQDDFDDEAWDEDLDEDAEEDQYADDEYDEPPHPATPRAPSREQGPAPGARKQGKFRRRDV